MLTGAVMILSLPGLRVTETEGIDVRTCLLATLILTAAAGAADVTGHYQLQNVREMGSELLLKPDGRFEFVMAYGAADYWAKGTWQSQNGTVILNTDTGEGQPPFRLLSSSPAKNEGVRVMVVAAGGRPVPNIDVVLEGAGGSVEARTGSDGAAEFGRIPGLRSATFRIRVYQFESEPIALNASHSDFRFEINGREITQVRFRNERLEPDGNSLVMRHWGADRPMRYSK